MKFIPYGTIPAGSNISCEEMLFPRHRLATVRRIYKPSRAASCFWGAILGSTSSIRYCKTLIRIA